MRFLTTIVLSLSILTYSMPGRYLVHADEPAGVSAQSGPAIVVAGKLEDAAVKVNSFADKLPSEGIVITIVVMAWDIVRRLWKTDKPASFLSDVAAMIRGFVGIINAFGRVLLWLAGLLDKVLGNRVKV